MSTKSKNLKKPDFASVLEMLSKFQLGDFAQELPESDDPILKPLIDKMNETARVLGAQSQSRFQAEKFLTLSPDLLCIAGVDGRFKKVNPTFSRVLGYSEAELLSKAYFEWIHPGDIPATLKVIENLAAGKTTIHFENRYRTKNGDYLVLDWSVSPDPLTGLLYAVGRDVTEEKRANASLKQILQALQDVSILDFTDKSGTITEVNDRFCEVSGYSREELLGQNQRILNSGTHSKEFFQEMWARLTAGKVWQGTIENRKKSGQTYLVESVISPILDVAGTVVGYVAIRFDVTSRRAVEKTERQLKATLKELESTSQLLEQTGEMAKIGGWELDLSTGRVQMSNQTLKLHEIDSSYIPPLYSTGGEWYPPEAWPKVRAAVQAAIEQGKPYDLESPFITAKGKRIWVRVQGFPILKGDKVIGLRGTFQDITERKQAELESQFVSDSIGFGIWKFDPVSRALEWDHQMYALYDVDPKDFTGAYAAWENTLTPAAKEKAVNELNFALSGQKEFNTEFEIRLKNGEVRHIAGRGIVIRNEKKEPIRMLGLNWDVTSRVRAEQELKAASIQLLRSSKLASLGEISAGIAHEINNPLAIIIGSVGLLMRFKDNPQKLGSKIEAIQKSCDRISKIVSGLRKFSRSDDKSIHRLHSLKDIAQEALTLTQPKAMRLSTTVSIESSVQTEILCDEIEIEQVLLNLISNGIDAVKNIPEKWVRLFLYEEGQQVVARVMDSGPGISEAVRTKLFEPFFTTKEVGEGTGLGLSISKGILDEHKATIAVLADGPHTCFEIRFPKAGKP